MSFKSVQKKIASQGHSMESAGAILADASRNASAAAKRANPKLKRVKGSKHDGGLINADGLYEMQKGERVIPAKKAEVSQVQAMGDPSHQDILRSNAHPHQADVEAPKNDCGVTGVGHFECDGNDCKFVKG
jgi:hypothetical protein